MTGQNKGRGAIAFTLVPESPKLRTVRTLVGQFVRTVIHLLFPINIVTFA